MNIFFLNFIFFYLEDIDLGSPKLHVIEIFNQPTFYKKNLVILAFIGAELAGRADSAPLPLPWRVLLNLIPRLGLSGRNPGRNLNLRQYSFWWRGPCPPPPPQLDIVPTPGLVSHISRFIPGSHPGSPGPVIPHPGSPYVFGDLS